MSACNNCEWTRRRIGVRVQSPVPVPDPVKMRKLAKGAGKGREGNPETIYILCRFGMGAHKDVQVHTYVAGRVKSVKNRCQRRIEDSAISFSLTFHSSTHCHRIVCAPQLVAEILSTISGDSNLKSRCVLQVNNLL